MQQHLDALILDYFHRSPESGLRISNKFRKLEHDHVHGSVRLEEIIAVYFDKFVENEPSALQPDASYTQLLHLPSEVLVDILKNCPVKQLLCLRRLSKRVNELCCSTLQNLCVTLKTLSSRDDAGEFRNVFGNQIEGGSFPFSTYRFLRDSQHAFGVLDLIGSQLKFARFESNDFPFEILAKLPNLQKLVLEANFPEGAQKNFKLHSLRVIHLSAMYHQYPEEKDLEYLENWLWLAPGLKEFKSEIPIEIDSASNLIALFHRHRFLQKISIQELSASFQNDKMSVSLLQHHRGQPEKYLSKIFVYSNNVQSLSLPRTHGLPLPDLLNVTSIKFHFIGGYPSEVLITPELFPALSHVTIDSGLVHLLEGTYEDVVFFGVESLVIEGIYIRLEGQEPLILHHIFPRVRRLGLGGMCDCPRHIDYFATHFTGISTLRFVNTDIIYHWNRARHHSERMLPKEWPFSKLNYLKEVEFVSPWKVRSLVSEVVTLTLNRSLQPLDSLTIRWTPPTEESKRVELSNQFYVLSRLGYHKNMKLVVLEQDFG